MLCPLAMIESERDSHHPPKCTFADPPPGAGGRARVDLPVRRTPRKRTASPEQTGLWRVPPHRVRKSVECLSLWCG